MMGSINVFRQVIPGRYRARFGAYFCDTGRCDTLSCCSRHASSLITIIHADMGGPKASQAKRHCYYYSDEEEDDDVKKQGEGTAKNKKSRRTDDDQQRDNNNNNNKSLRCGLSDAGYADALALLNGGGDGLLFLRHSNQLALATIAEALLQAQRPTTIVSDQCRMQKAVAVLEALERVVDTDYAVTVKETTDARLSLLKHLGKGIALLKETRDARFLRK